MSEIYKAWSVLEARKFSEDDDFVYVDGIATTPTPDRVGDVVDPMGAQFKTPMPLLLYHQSTLPVGNVVFAKQTKTGIPFKATIPKVKEPGVVQDRTNEAIHSLKYHLINAVSIGFKALKDGVEILKTGGLHFKMWEWLELSLVSVPANSEAIITAVKSLDQAARASAGNTRGVVENAADNSGQKTSRPVQLIPRRKPAQITITPR
ncbi:MAG: HK97 family phage prohead protease [Gallionella sp.]|jgi:HK97 family phage prohead protease